MSVGCSHFVRVFVPQILALLLIAPGSFAQESPPTATIPPVLEPDPEPDLAARIKLDSDRLIFSYIRDDAPVLSERDSQQEFEAYNEVLIHARQFRLVDLLTHSRSDVTFSDLLNKTRRDFQFQLLLIEGRLKRLRSLELNKPLREAGVTALYEGWIFPRESGIHMHDPMCVLFTELPPGLTPEMEYNPAKMVRFPGYSFKLMRYESQDPDPKNAGQGKIRRAPLLMGRSIIVDPDPDTDGGQAWRTTFIPVIMVGLATLAGLTLALNWYYRRDDHRHKLARARRMTQNPFGSDEPPSTSEPAN